MMTAKAKQTYRLLGVELYYENLPRARDFYADLLGLALEEEKPDHHVKLAPQDGFLCLERKGVENYPSRDKAVVFLEVADLRRLIASVGEVRFVRIDLKSSPPWAVLQDPEDHNVVFIQAAKVENG